MTETSSIPRRGAEPDPIRALAGQLAQLRKDVARLGKSASLRNASISDAAGTVRLRFSTDEGAIVAYSAEGEEVARYGQLAHSDVGAYGIEALAGGTWVHVGDESVTWDNIAGRPETFPPTLPLDGAAVEGAVGEATHAALADGSRYGYENPVGGTTFYALWVGNDGGYHLGRNVSSRRYKENIRPLVPSGDLQDVAPVVYDRRATENGPGAADEFGLIAEDVYEVWPEVVTWFDHGDGEGPVIDGIRYDLIGPRLIPYIQELQTTVASLRDREAERDKLVQELAAKVKALGG